MLRILFLCFPVLGLGLSAPLSVRGQPILNTTLNDFFMPGTQPQTLVDPLISANGCDFCHGDFHPETGINKKWRPSMMAQAMRDPLFHACLAIAEQDAAFVGDLCLRCHTPNGWLGGRSVPTSGSALDGFQGDFDGVSCQFCHRMVDPVYQAGVNPADDVAVLAGLANVPLDFGNAQYVVDPLDRRRGPYNLVSGFSFHEWRRSPFHREAAMCGTCHDVSNPVYSRVGDDYVLNALDEPHPTQNKYDQFPIERTFSEWQMSAFAQGPIDMGGRFGGNNPLVSTCQDCHMPKTTGYGCSFTGSSILRTDQPMHHFNGSHTWVLDAIIELDLTLSLYNVPSYLPPSDVAAAKARNIDMLEAASDLELSVESGALKVRVINQTGHKLPSGYPEGRRIWINVQFLDDDQDLLLEHGAYDWFTAELDASSTKVYETKLGLDNAVATLTGRPAGEGFHFALNNKIFKDNRIPPRGFTNAGFAAVQAAPVAYSYADGQYWDDTLYPIPPGATSAEVMVYYQTASKEYIDFLHTANVTNNAGQVLYDVWVATGKGPPVMMDFGGIILPPADFVRANCNGDSSINIADPIYLLGYLFQGQGPLPCEDACDSNDDGTINIADAVTMLNLLFNQGMIPAPYPLCGPDPTVDGLSCKTWTCP